MKCQSVEERLSAYIDKEVGEEDKAFSRHFAHNHFSARRPV